MRRFTVLLALLILAGPARADRWPGDGSHGGSGTTYVSTVADSVLGGDGAGGYAEVTTVRAGSGVLTADTALRVGGATATDVRLEETSGVLGVRLGDDSADAVAAAASLTASAAPGASGAANTTSYGGTGITIEGADDGNEGLIDFMSPSADWEMNITPTGGIAWEGAGRIETGYTAGSHNLVLAAGGVANIALQAYGIDSSGVSAFKLGGIQMNVPQTFTIADSGGPGAATSTASPTRSAVEATCNDADGCEWTIGDSGMEQVPALIVINLSANNLVIKESAGNVELIGSADQTLGQYDVINLRWTTDRWVQAAPIANN